MINSGSGGNNKNIPPTIKSNPSAKIYLEVARKHKDNTIPVKMRVTYRRESKYYPCKYLPEDPKSELLWIPGKPIAMTKKEFEEVMDPGSRGKNRLKQLYIKRLETRANEVLAGLLKSHFSFKAFEKKYLSKPSNEDNLIYGLDEKAKSLRKNGRIATAVLIATARISLVKFLKREYLEYEDLTSDLLERYEKWMMEPQIKKDKVRINSLTTVGMYVRAIRAVYNNAKRNGVFKSDIYPFGNGGYMIPTGLNIKKALTQQQVGMIANYPTVNGTPIQRYRDYWIMSYLCNGINIKDLARLKYKNITDEIITLVRAKTSKEMQGTPRTIVIPITKHIGKIIDRWGNKPAAPGSYIFPILTDTMTPEQEYQAIRQTTKMINQTMKTIAEQLGIPGRLTTYTARHTFSTVLKRSGASTEFISESLGHSNVKTTARYLASFESDVKRRWAESLLPDDIIKKTIKKTNDN